MCHPGDYSEKRGRACLTLFFLIVSLVELALLIEVGKRLGTANTVILLLMSALAGAVVVRRQGSRLLREIILDLRLGRVPAGPLVDAALVAAAGLLLLTPGFVTDAAGFALLVPGIRRQVKRVLHGWWRRRLLIP